MPLELSCVFGMSAAGMSGGCDYRIEVNIIRYVMEQQSTLDTCVDMFIEYHFPHDGLVHDRLKSILRRSIVLYETHMHDMFDDIEHIRSTTTFSDYASDDKRPQICIDHGYVCLTDSDHVVYYRASTVQIKNIEVYRQDGIYLISIYVMDEHPWCSYEARDDDIDRLVALLDACTLITTNAIQRQLARPSRESTHDS